MLIFLYGPDLYRRQESYRKVLANYQKNHPALTIECFDIEGRAEEQNFAWARLKDFIKNRSLFDAWKLAVVRGVECIAEQAEEVAWLKGLRDGKETTVLISADGAPPEPLAFLTRKPVVSEEFKFLTGVAFKQFVETEARARGAHCTEAQLADLSAQYRDDMWGLVTELDKIALSNFQFLPISNRGSSTAVGTISNFQFRNDFFMMVKTLAYGRVGQQLVALEELLNSDDPAKIFNFLAALVSGNKKIQMADYDVAIKSGKLDYEAALLDFALSA